MRKRLLLLLVAALPLVLAGVAMADDDREDSQLDRVRRATAAYTDVNAAVADGYTLRLPDAAGLTCIATEKVGGMGVHMVNPSLLDDKLEATKPEVLVYDPEVRSDGSERLRLVAVEYVIFWSAWDGDRAPKLFGTSFDYVGAGNRYGLDPFFALHAWIWKRNSSGLFYAWNPRVRC
jgi:hypothetical protein